MVLARFLPRDERFFEYFHDAASNAVEVAELMVAIFEDYEDVERKVRRMRDLERRGDEITHQIFNALNRAFVTPFDREDISALASRIDDFVDYVEETARRMWLYRMDRPTAPARAQARVIREQARAIAEAVGFLSDLKQSEMLLRVGADIDRLEHEADDVFNNALAVLYDDATDIPSLIKAIRWGELYADLESATDRGNDVANTLEGIMLKHA
jgi:uncharacterized protein